VSFPKEGDWFVLQFDLRGRGSSGCFCFGRRSTDVKGGSVLMRGVVIIGFQ